MGKPEEQIKETPAPKRETLIWGLPRLVASFVVVTVASAVVYRMATVQCNLQFDFSAFLSLLLALFAVGLSALFYFKTTETSNAFYDNTHKFTREVSQILGRIEAGFGERLRHLDEGYTGLRDKFEKLPFDVSKAREQEKEEEQEVAKKEAEIQDLLNNLAERAKLAEAEKKELFASLEQTQEDLNLSKRELRQLQQRIRDAEEQINVPDHLRDYLRHRLSVVLEENRMSLHGGRVDPRVVIRAFKSTMDDLNQDALRDMKRHSLLDQDGDLTSAGVRLVRSILTENGSDN